MTPPTADTTVLPRWLRGWEQFWFTPADPSVLALIRIGCGMIVVYTLFVYSFNLQEFMGEHAWNDLQLQREKVHEVPRIYAPLNWNEAGQLPEPKKGFQTEYRRNYRSRFGVWPPPPYPVSPEQADYLDTFRAQHGIDLRLNGLQPSDDPDQRNYAEIYTNLWRVPPPAYPKDREEALQIDEYMFRWGVDPRRVYAKGMPTWSIWFHVTDPTAMAIVHGLIVFSAFLFTIGFGTRFTSALTWFGSLCYIHRDQAVLFGVDTMMTIVLFYLLISPCGAAWSVDRLIRKWWVKAKPGVVAWWYRLLRRPAPTDLAPAAPVPDLPEPSIAANVAIRLLQIHLCIIYLIAGLAKLLGRAWWDGSAIWMTLGNYEFAPMQFDLYLRFLRFLGSHQLLYEAFMTGGGLFTLAFEIGYAFLVWRPRLRWFFLASALLLHGGIGLFLGLKTFSFMMLVMNMAFLRKEEVYWLFSLLPGSAGAAKNLNHEGTESTEKCKIGEIH
jgi:hypothetical protein